MYEKTAALMNLNRAPLQRGGSYRVARRSRRVAAFHLQDGVATLLAHPVRKVTHAATNAG